MESKSPKVLSFCWHKTDVCHESVRWRNVKNSMAQRCRAEIIIRDGPHRLICSWRVKNSGRKFIVVARSISEVHLYNLKIQKQLRFSAGNLFYDSNLYAHQSIRVQFCAIHEQQHKNHCSCNFELLVKLSQFNNRRRCNFNLF